MIQIKFSRYLIVLNPVILLEPRKYIFIGNTHVVVNLQSVTLVMISEAEFGFDEDKFAGK